MFINLNNNGKVGANDYSTNNENDSAENNVNKVEIKDIMTGEELMKMKVTHIPTLVDPILPKVGLTALIGTSDIGKSTLLLQLCRNVVLDDTFLDFKLTPEHRNAIYVSTEDDASSISYRLQHLKIDETKLKGLRCVFNSDKLEQTLERMLKQQRADIVAIDTFADIFTGDMNQNTSVRNCMEKFSILAMKYQCLIIFNHHTGKKTEDKPPHKDHAIGSVGFEGKSRVVIELRQDYLESGKRHFCIVKGNYLGSEYKTSSFVLNFDAKLGLSSTGKRKDFCELAKPKEARAVPTKDKQKQIVLRLHIKKRSIRRIQEVLKRLRLEVSTGTINNWIRDKAVQQ